MLSRSSLPRSFRATAGAQLASQARSHWPIRIGQDFATETVAPLAQQPEPTVTDGCIDAAADDWITEVANTQDPMPGTGATGFLVAGLKLGVRARGPGVTRLRRADPSRTRHSAPAAPRRPPGRSTNDRPTRAAPPSV